ncbi:MAG: YggS family pyridoxal phosphate-dependent enzyme [Candidatus Kryptonium sp.]|nr:YggS family pyridoxal phosphate-dependent enzyme [Candidatus Kryptonium sp.]MCX7761590.1 YggS family pyridoxal phosphate-dependent enzyme [Candidatus Kryptonium sp.]MDW8108502.1 YggS family pyridoxal phosphate-dependent enzyme [Candidatus Kryptonium sp.]
MIAENIYKIRQKIREVCQKVGRNPEEITIVAVTKTVPVDKIKEAINAGINDIGENRVQELLEKKSYIDIQNVRWHFVGHLQTNKVKYIVDFVHLIHSVDSLKLALEIEKRAKRINRIVDVLIEVNTSGEKTKYGVKPEETTELVKQISESCEFVRIKGLMTVAAYLPNPEDVRPMFKLLRQLSDEIKKLDLKNVEMKHLSMGMSNDYWIAVEEGATIVRIGTAIFGPRN